MSAPREAFVGIDAAFAKRKRLPVALCRWEGERLLPYPLRTLSVEPPQGSGNAAVLDDEVVREFAVAAVRYVERVADELGVEVVRIGIDAPSIPCPEGQRRREAERALHEAGISCFGTPSVSRLEEIRAKVRAHLDGGGPQNRMPHANQLWMIVGFALFEQFSKLAPCIEVFPQATARVLGAGGLHKFKAGGVEAQLRAVARHTGWPADGEGSAPLSSIAWAPRHDCLDAYLSAWVAALDEKDRLAFGTPPGDVIWVPRVSDDDLAQAKPRRVASPSLAFGRSGPAALSVRSLPSGRIRSRRRRPTTTFAPGHGEYPCPLPGCDKVFQGGRGGWDAHVGSKRMHPDWHPGVNAPDERKRLFRKEYEGWFRS